VVKTYTSRQAFIVAADQGKRSGARPTHTWDRIVVEVAGNVGSGSPHRLTAADVRHAAAAYQLTIDGLPYLEAVRLATAARDDGAGGKLLGVHRAGGVRLIWPGDRFTVRPPVERFLWVVDL
jgi:hypothetical protein